jgi:hypothetical protein
MTRPRSVRSGLVPRQRFIARRILASTYRLVDQVMAEDWERVPGTLKERRSMLAHLHEARPGSNDAASCIAALHSAVAESERFVSVILPPSKSRVSSG